MASDDIVDINQPDYGLTLEQVYLRLAKTWITSQDKLDILSCCKLSGRSKLLTELPSWVPDWRFSRPSSTIRTSFETCARTFNASLDSLAGYEFSQNGESEILVLNGFRAGVIEEMEKVRLRYQDHRFQEWRVLAQKVPEDPVIFWLTCIRERAQGGGRLDPQQREDFDHCIRNWIPSQTEEWPSFGSQSLKELLLRPKVFYIW